MSDPLDNRPLNSPCPGAEVTDEEIMAYADGVLANERLPAVREELANNPERMKTLEAYLKTKEAMAHALGPILVATVPERLRDTIHELAAAPAPARGLGALLRSAVGGHLFAKLRVPMLAVAALCLVFLGAWLGDYAKRTANPQPELVRWEPRGLVLEPALQHALDTTPSGEEAKLSGRVAIKPVATLRTEAGILCREFDLLNGGRLGGRSLACRPYSNPRNIAWPADLGRSSWAKRCSKAPSRASRAPSSMRTRKWISSRDSGGRHAKPASRKHPVDWTCRSVVTRQKSGRRCDRSPRCKRLSGNCRPTRCV
jgi:anti-sigma factor RsiW